MIYALVFSILAITFLQAPRTSGDWYWDLANGIGFTAFALLLYLFIDSGTGVRQRIHQLLSYALAGLILLHILLLWVPDTAVWHYLSLDAPHYMWAGILSIVPLVILTLTSTAKSRREWHGTYQTFRKLHTILSIVTVALVLWHIIGSGFYLSVLESALIILLAILVYWGSQTNRFKTPSQSLWVLGYVGLLPLAFVALKFML